MKIFSISSYLNLSAISSCQNIRSHFYRAAPALKRTVSDTLYSRISPLGDPNSSVVPVLDQWIGEGNYACKGEIQRVINELTTYKRFKHALEVSLWMTNKRKFLVAPIDVAVRLKLIFKNFGLEQVEDYFSKTPENLKTFHVYLALLNCYTIAKSVDGAESIMQKARDLGFANKPIWYNHMMNLHHQLGNREKLGDLLNEMETKGISYDSFTYSVRLRACAVASDAAGMEKIMKSMESNTQITGDWKTYVVAARAYLKMGLTDKALEIVNKLEDRLTTCERKYLLFVFLFNLYADAGKKEEVYRVWNLYKQNGKFLNKVYHGMMLSLLKFDDIEGMEKIFEEWELAVVQVRYDFRIPNFLIDAYCTQGHLERAEALITKGISKGGTPLVQTWCHLAGGYLKKNQAPQAVEALKKAISICPPTFKSRRDAMITCLEYLQKGDCIEKAEESIKFLRMVGSMSKEVDLDDDLSGLSKDEELP